MFNLFESLTDISSLTGIATISTMLLGAISLFIANMGRYIQAKTFGIPIRAIHQANISDSADLWVALVGTFGFSIFIPVIMLGIDVFWWIRFLIVIISFVLGLFSTKSLLRVRTGKKEIKDGKEYYVTKDFPVLFITIISVIAAGAYLRIFYMYQTYMIYGSFNRFGGFFEGFVSVTSAVVLGIYIIIVFSLLVLNVLTRMFGSRDIMTVSIDGQNYLITMRHSFEKWILHPCDVVNYNEYYKKDNSLYEDVKIILYEKGNFMIRDLSTLRTPIIYYANAGIDEKGRLK